jgi:glycosyltransferase involved in cell wall biosynthesis
MQHKLSVPVLALSEACVSEFLGGSTPRIAVVTASYNRLDGLRRLHASLLRQSQCSNWIHVIVDDSSFPELDPHGICDDLRRVHFERNVVNSGPLVTRNRAIDCALAYRADVIAFVDDDDFVTDDFFEYISAMWDAHRDVGWYVSRCKFMGKDFPNYHVWPESDGIYDWFDDMQLDRKFGADVCHVVAARRIQGVRFSSCGRYQREWTLLAKLARQGGFYASNRVTKVSTYSPDGLTLSSRGPAPDLVSCWNFVSKPAILVLNRPQSVRAWKMLLRQAGAFPVRLCSLAAQSVYRSVTGER